MRNKQDNDKKRNTLVSVSLFSSKSILFREVLFKEFNLQSEKSQSIVSSKLHPPEGKAAIIVEVVFVVVGVDRIEEKFSNFVVKAKDLLLGGVCCTWWIVVAAA